MPHIQQESSTMTTLEEEEEEAMFGHISSQFLSLEKQMDEAFFALMKSDVVPRSRTSETSQYWSTDTDILATDPELKNLQKELDQADNPSSKVHPKELEQADNLSPPPPKQHDDTNNSVQVAVRVRPMLPHEKKEDTPCIEVTSTNARDVTVVQLTGGEGASSSSGPKNYTFDEVFSLTRSQAEVFQNRVKPLVTRCLEGHNATVLAYGQTGSGKTHTMMGPISSIKPTSPLLNEEQTGVIPRAIRSMFEQLHRIKEQRKSFEYTVRIQFVEVYGEEIRDLLLSKRDSLGSKGLPIRDLGTDKPEVVGATEAKVGSTEQALLCLMRGMRRRVTGVTTTNEESSRSHVILSLVVEQSTELSDDDAIWSSDKTTQQKQLQRSKLNFVDLAGNEGKKVPSKESGSRLKNNIDINKGLLVLGNVISAVGDLKKQGETFVRYRDSKLTQLLKGSLGGNHKTLVLACVSPASSNMDETLKCLRYANHAKHIKNRAVAANVDATSRLVAVLREKMKMLATDLLKARGGKKSDCSIPIEVLMLIAGGGDGEGIQLGIQSRVDGNSQHQLLEEEKRLITLEIEEIKAKNEDFRLQIEAMSKIEKDLTRKCNEYELMEKELEAEYEIVQEELEKVKEEHKNCLLKIEAMSKEEQISTQKAAAEYDHLQKELQTVRAYNDASLVQIEAMTQEKQSFVAELAKYDLVDKELEKVKKENESFCSRIEEMAAVEETLAAKPSDYELVKEGFEKLKEENQNLHVNIEAMTKNEKTLTSMVADFNIVKQELEKTKAENEVFRSKIDESSGGFTASINESNIGENELRALKEVNLVLRRKIENMSEFEDALSLKAAKYEVAEEELIKEKAEREVLRSKLEAISKGKQALKTEKEAFSALAAKTDEVEEELKRVKAENRAYRLKIEASPRVEKAIVARAAEYEREILRLKRQGGGFLPCLLCRPKRAVLRLPQLTPPQTPTKFNVLCPEIDQHPRIPHLQQPTSPQTPTRLSDLYPRIDQNPRIGRTHSTSPEWSQPEVKNLIDMPQPVELPVAVLQATTLGKRVGNDKNHNTNLSGSMKGDMLARYMAEEEDFLDQAEENIVLAFASKFLGKSQSQTNLVNEPTAPTKRTQRSSWTAGQSSDVMFDDSVDVNALFRSAQKQSQMIMGLGLSKIDEEMETERVINQASWLWSRLFHC